MYRPSPIGLVYPEYKGVSTGGKTKRVRGEHEEDEGKENKREKER